jgi:phosphatidate cytidylyltransferase
VLYLPTAWLGVLLGLLILLAAGEWARLAGLAGRREQWLYMLIVALLGGLAAWGTWIYAYSTLVLTSLALLWWIYAFADLWRHAGDASGPYRSSGGRLIAGALVLVPAWLATLHLHRTGAMGPAVVLYTLALVWIADTSAYFVGRAWGRTPLAPKVSPGKTVEGLLGALVSVVVVAYFCGTMIWRLSGRMLGGWMLLAVAAALFSVVGDLVESKLKRLAGVKDSGAWLPGHGGVLDRIDALTAAVPVFAWGWTIFLKAGT